VALYCHSNNKTTTKHTNRLCRDKWKCRRLSLISTADLAGCTKLPLPAPEPTRAGNQAEPRHAGPAISPPPPWTRRERRSGGASVALAGRELLAVQDYAVVVEMADCFHSCGQINRETITRCRSKRSISQHHKHALHRPKSSFPPREKTHQNPRQRGQKPHRRGATRTPIPRDGSRASIPDRGKPEPHPHCTDTAVAPSVGPIKPATYQYARRRPPRLGSVHRPAPWPPWPSRRGRAKTLARGEGRVLLRLGEHEEETVTVRVWEGGEGTAGQGREGGGGGEGTTGQPRPRRTSARAQKERRGEQVKGGDWWAQLRDWSGERCAIHWLVGKPTGWTYLADGWGGRGLRR